MHCLQRSCVKNEFAQILPLKAADLFPCGMSLGQHEMRSTYKEYQSQWGQQKLQPRLTFRATTSSQGAAAIPTADVLPPCAEVTLCGHLHANRGWVWYKWHTVKEHLDTSSVWLVWKSVCSRTKCVQVGARGKSWQRGDVCPLKFRNSGVCRWWIYGENQSQTNCHQFYLHLNCLPTGLRMQYNLIKSMKMYFCLRCNVLLCSHLMSCELTCFNKSFIAYYILLPYQ